ncbi:MAG: hypothetical protein PVI21_04370 [Candidatus Woesebacteria bacterium]
MSSAINTSATALGRSASAGSYATAVGQSASASGNYATAVGRSASAGSYATAVGQSASASGTVATAVGRSASASGSSSIAVGYAASASDSATAVGRSATASADYATALGNSASASGDSSTALGSYAKADRYGQHATSNGHFTTAGDARHVVDVLRITTTDATGTELSADGATSGYITIAATRTMACTIRVAAHRTDVSGTAAAWAPIHAAITRDATGNCRLLGTPTGTGTTTMCDAGATTWTVAVTADSTNNRLAITVTGEAAKTIRWVATVEMAEVG